MAGSGIDSIIEELAKRQHGVVSRAQLLAAGMGAHTIDNGVKRGRLRRVHRGVYRVGPPVAPRATTMAAVLACGPEAAVGYGSAAGLWGLRSAPPPSAPVDVVVPGAGRARRPGIRVHRARDLRAADVTCVDRIPVTRPARTLFDLAPSLTARQLERAWARAEREGLVRPDELMALVARAPQRRGAVLLRALCEAGAEPAHTRSEAEERLLALIARGGLPRPEVNVRVAGYEVDFLWRAAGVVVEVDGFAYHGSRTRFEADRRRDGDLSAAGLRVLRFTWRQIVEEPEVTLVTLAQVLAMGRMATAPRV